MQSVLITGATSGLGRGLALEFARRGATLGLLARREEALAQVAREVAGLGAQAHYFVADVRDGAATEAAIREFARLTGRLDVVIANAGVGEGRRTERFDASKVAEVFDINLKGLTNTLLPALEIMRETRSGTLVGMASVAAFRALPGSLAYSASKGAVLTFMEGLNLELHGSGIHAMSLCPGFVRTPLTDKNDFKMPFRIECDDACRRMVQAIVKKRSRYTFPFPMAIAAQLMRVAPHWLLRSVAPKGPKRRRR